MSDESKRPENETGDETPEAVDAEIVEDEPAAAAASDADEEVEAAVEEPEAAAAPVSEDGNATLWWTLGIVGVAAVAAVVVSIKPEPAAETGDPIVMAEASDAELAAGRPDPAPQEADDANADEPEADEPDEGAGVTSDPSADEGARNPQDAADAKAAAVEAAERAEAEERAEAQRRQAEEAAANEAEEALVEEVPVDGADVEDVEVEEAPVEEGDAEETPAEEAPAKAAAADESEASAQAERDDAEAAARADEERRAAQDEADREAAERQAAAEAEARQVEAARAAAVAEAEEARAAAEEAAKALEEERARRGRVDALVEARIGRLEQQLDDARARADEALKLARENPENDGEVEALQQRIADLSREIEDLRGGVSSKIENDITSLKNEVLAETLETQRTIAADREALRRQVAEIERLRAEIRSAMAERDETAGLEIERLRQRVDKLQTEDVAKASKAASVSLALLNLQRQVAAGRPFENELKVLRSLAPSAAPLDQLQAYAEEGLPSAALLQRTFDDEAREALRTANRAENGGILGSFRNLVTVRKAGDVPGASSSAIISRAETRLEAGDLQGAVQELDALGGPAAEAMAEWLDAARARVAVDDLMDGLSERLIGDIDPR